MAAVTRDPAQSCAYVGLDPAYRVDFAEDWMQCRSHSNRKWCEHIEAVVTTQRDAAWIWENPRDYLIPMFPSHNLYETVTIGTTDVAGSRPIKHNGQHVGFLSEFDGRRVIRQILMDSLVPVEDMLKCKSRLHGPGAERQLAANPDLAPANRWCMAQYGLCLPCNAVADNIAPDAVPDIL